MTLLYRVMVVFWLSVLAAAKSVLRLSYSKLEHQYMIDTHGHKFLGVVLCLGFRVGCRRGG